LGYKSLYSDWAAGWMIQRTIAGRRKGFFSSSEHPQLYRGPLSLPFNNYWKFFPWRQNSGVKLTTHFHLELRLRKSGDRVFTLIIKPNRCTNFSQIYYWNKTTHFRQFLCPSPGVFHCTHCKLSANLYDMYHCCVYSEKLLTMDRGTVGNM